MQTLQWMLQWSKNEHLKAFKNIGCSRIAERYSNFKHYNGWNDLVIGSERDDTKRVIKDSLFYLFVYLCDVNRSLRNVLIKILSLSRILLSVPVKCSTYDFFQEASLHDTHNQRRTFFTRNN